MQRLFYAWIVLLIVSLSVRMFLYFHFSKQELLPRDQPIRFEATIKNEPKIYDSGQVISIADAKIYTGFYPRFRVGDRVFVEGEVDNRGRMFEAKITKIGQKTGLSTLRSRARETISTKIASILPSREATLVSGTVLGVDTISSDFKDQLIRTGTIHVVVVSGQNLSIVAGVFSASAKLIGRRKSLVLTILAISAYAFLAGFEPPVVRASLMVLASSLAVFAGREVNPLWSLFLAAALIVFIWPQALMEASFQLTFAATFGIMTLGKKLAKFLERLPIIGENAAVATSAYLFTAPIIIFYFGQTSAISPLANILVAEVVAVIMILGFLISFASLLFLPLAQLLAYFAFVPTFYFVQVVQIFATLPFGQIKVSTGNIFIALLLCTFVLVLTFTLSGNSKTLTNNGS